MKRLRLLAAMPLLAALAAGAAAPARPPLPGGVAPCESCHGARGEGNPAVLAPRLAAQPQAYLARQLAAFADGRRPSPVMTPVAQALDGKLRDRLAAYYAALDAPQAAAGTAKGSERGRRLALRGDEERGIQACANCHGPDGIGEPPTYPYLGGQQRAYLLAALKAWRDGRRDTDASGQMPAIARRLNEQDMAALADYYAAARAPQADSFRAARRPSVPPAAAAPAARPPAGAVGSEQGGPTSGGGQGPGGGGATQEERPR